MKIFKNKSLKQYNTFQIDVKAGVLAIVSSEREVIDLIREFKDEKKMVLGGGSNVLFTKNFDGVVIKNEILGINISEESQKHCVVEVGGGVNWHEFVRWAIENDYSGVENMALIPGTVGAAPVQNIAAYGQNFVDVFEGLTAFSLDGGKRRRFTKDECRLAYRSSIFKNEYKDQYLITRVRIGLSKIHKLETDYFMIGISYDSIKNELQDTKKESYTIKDVFEAVTRLRKKKIPDETKEPNVGSFFLNPAIKKEKLEKFKTKIKELQYYPMSQLTYPEMNDSLFKSEEYVKVPAGRLLDELGWRGKKIGNCWMHENQALILVTNGKATGDEILKFSKKVKQSCKDTYGIELESEVNIY